MKPLLAITLCLGLTACDKGAEEASALTTSADGTHYNNARFGMSVSKPEGWYAMDIKESLAQMQQGSAMVAGSDQNMQAMMDASLKSTLPLFSFYATAPGSRVTANANISGVAESVEALPGIKTGCDYLYQMKKVLEQSQVKIEFPQDCQNTSLNGNNFGYQEARLSVGTVTVNQRYYACLNGRHALAVIHNYTDEKGAQTLSGVMETLKLSCDA